MKLLEKVAIITGAGSGIGRATACLFAREGARVVVADIIAPAGQETVDRILADGGEAVFVQVDVSRSDEVAAMICAAVNRYGRLDILHNNAGIATPRKPLWEVPEDEWERLMSVNLKGVYLGCYHAVPVLKRGGGGVILNTASLAAIVVRPGSAAYCTSKAGVAMLTRVLARELAPYNIRVNCISPVAVDTPIISDEYRRERGKEIPLGQRLVKPEEVADAALFLCSDAASMITGEQLIIDGGARG